MFDLLTHGSAPRKKRQHRALGLLGNHRNGRGFGNGQRRPRQARGTAAERVLEFVGSSISRARLIPSWRSPFSTSTPSSPSPSPSGNSQIWPLSAHLHDRSCDPQLASPVLRPDPTSLPSQAALLAPLPTEPSPLRQLDPPTLSSSTAIPTTTTQTFHSSSTRRMQRWHRRSSRTTPNSTKRQP